MTKLTVNADLGKQRISRHIYGHFAEHLGRCIYDGLWVGNDSSIPNTRGLRNDIVAALKNLRIPNLRWPGGCFADTYHWMDGIGPSKDRPGIVNVHWGEMCESNHFGTHEFMDLCEMLGTPGGRCEPYICGNVGSGTVREMAQWLEYLTMPGESPLANLRRRNGRDKPWDLTYWSIGNENWGCGGNMSAQQYAWEYRRFQTYCRNFSGKTIYKVACGYDDAWNEVVLREAHPFIDGLSIHHYSLPSGSFAGPKGAATGFTCEQWISTLAQAWRLETVLDRTAAILDRYDPLRRIGIVLDEWGAWYDPQPGTNPAFHYQQNTVRDAVLAGITLNILNNRAARVHLANIAQIVNVLQAMILTDGPRMLLTPTYHLFEMYKVHQDATLLPSHLECDLYTIGQISIPRISASVSRDAQGRIHLSLVNAHHEKDEQVVCELRGILAAPTAATGRIVTGPSIDSHNTFEIPDRIRAESFRDVTIKQNTIAAVLPAKSVVMLEVS